VRQWRLMVAVRLVGAQQKGGCGGEGSVVRRAERRAASSHGAASKTDVLTLSLHAP
jgi:hypothetical protein